MLDSPSDLNFGVCIFVLLYQPMGSPLFILYARFDKTKGMEICYKGGMTN
jgi:hypothetical protein